jgi:hypothetical protein
LESLPNKVSKTSHPEPHEAVAKVIQIKKLEAQIAGLQSHVEEFHKILLEDKVLSSSK